MTTEYADALYALAGLGALLLGVGFGMLEYAWTTGGTGKLAVRLAALGVVVLLGATVALG